jgi:hypothetical protein
LHCPLRFWNDRGRQRRSRTDSHCDPDCHSHRHAYRNANGYATDYSITYSQRNADRYTHTWWAASTNATPAPNPAAPSHSFRPLVASPDERTKFRASSEVQKRFVFVPASRKKGGAESEQFLLRVQRSRMGGETDALPRLAMPFGKLIKRLNASKRPDARQRAILFWGERSVCEQNS